MQLPLLPAAAYSTVFSLSERPAPRSQEYPRSSVSACVLLFFVLSFCFMLLCDKAIRNNLTLRLCPGKGVFLGRLTSSQRDRLAAASVQF
jgi:hypothetical protein